MTIFAQGSYVLIKNKKARELISYLLCEKGHPVSKQKIASELWPDVPEKNAMDSLYKICKCIRNMVKDNIYIPILAEGRFLRMDITNVMSDILEFDKLYNDINNIESCIKAIELYQGQLLYDEYYNWTNQWAAYYDIRYFELLRRVINYYNAQGSSILAEFYKKKYEAE